MTINMNDFKGMMPHTVAHAPVSSRDSYGKITYGAATSYAARVVYKNKQVRSATGEVVMAAGMVWFLGTVSMSGDDKITLPDGSTPQVISVEKYADDDGDRFTKIYFG